MGADASLQVRRSWNEKEGGDGRAVAGRVPYLQVRVRYWDVVVLALILGQQFEPAADGTPEDLAHTKGQRPHEVVSGCAVPVPHLHRQPPVPLVAAHRAGEADSSD